MKRRVLAALAFSIAAALGPVLAIRSSPRSSPAAETADALVLWVELDPAAARSAAPPALSQDALDRRSATGIPLLEGDRPIPDSLIHAVAATGAAIRHVSRWLRAVSVATDSAGAQRLRALDFVRRIRPVGKLETTAAKGGGRRSGGIAAEEVGGPVRSIDIRPAFVQAFDSAYYGANWSALRQLGIPAVHSFGFTGSGVRIAILDTGFEPRHESLAGRRIFAARDFINGDVTVYDEPGEGGTDQEVHGTRVWSLLGASLPGTLVGVAPDAEFLLAKVDLEPGDSDVDEDRWVAAIEWADSLGARIVSSSLVYRFDFTDKAAYPLDALDGDQTPTTRAADAAARRGLLIVNAMGNDGPGAGSLSAPADADSIIAVGAVSALGQAAAFPDGASARGPTGDGRTKPELAARGVGLFVASSRADAAYDEDVAGTSYATPFISGAAALFMEAWPDLDAMAVRNALLLAGQQATPDNAIGRGRVAVDAAILAPLGIRDMREASIDLERNLTTLAPTFSWTTPQLQSAMRPVRFRIELALDPVFDNVIHTDTAREAFSLQLSQALRPAQAIWWRVIAEAQGGVRRVSPVSSPFTMPSWVRLISPAGNRVTFVNTQRPELSWAPLSAPPPVGPLVYDIEIFDVADGRLAQPAIRGTSEARVQVPQPLTPNNAYRWRVIAHTQIGTADTTESTAPFVVTSDQQPPATLLYQNFPNPFPRPDLGTLSTRIWFDLASPSPVELAVFDLRGRLVRRLIPADPSCGVVSLDPGQYGRLPPGAPPDPCILTAWDGTDQGGERVSRGVYVLRLRADDKVEYRRVVFLPE